MTRELLERAKRIDSEINSIDKDMHSLGICLKESKKCAICEYNDLIGYDPLVRFTDDEIKEIIQIKINKLQEEKELLMNELNEL